ncbi:MAG: serine/threonine protein kinase [Oscillospiraceae bacterium]|nr:serine/threonine protein kinase [Oscillospiraceae bacterium]
MVDYTREALKEGCRITLTEAGTLAEHAAEFTIEKCIGQGGSCYVYIAGYKSGGIEHTCILKELYPKECGLYRRDGIQLDFWLESTENGDMRAKYQARYKEFEARFLDGYRLQLALHDGRKKFRGNKPYRFASAVSAPRGLYRSAKGILYTVYDYSGGESYDQKSSENESLKDILDVITQTAEFLEYVHMMGYLMLDIKEQNILIVGSKGNRHVMMFDFGSMVRKEDLANYTCRSGMTLEFSSHDPDMIPEELKQIKNHFRKNQHSYETWVRGLGEYGEGTDTALLAAILFRRIFGRAPKKNEISPAWQFAENDFSNTKATLSNTKELLEKIFRNALAVKMRDRYSEKINQQDQKKTYHPMKRFIADCREVKLLSFLEESSCRQKMQEHGIAFLNTSVTPGTLLAASQKHFDTLSSEKEKFYHQHRFSDRFNSGITLLDEAAKPQALEDVIMLSRKILIQGDGGMGKSTMIYDFWKRMLHNSPSVDRKICLYIDLSRYADVQKQEQERAAQYGNTAKLLPRELLSYMEVNILQPLNGLLVHNQSEVLHEETLQQMQALHEMLSHESGEPQFVLFLDGYNEILNASERDAFCTRLNEAAAIWKNARFIVTSRSLSEEQQARFEGFSCCTMTGIPDEEITLALQEHKNMDTENIEQLRCKPIWDILKIPMFLNMYLQINMENQQELNTRGEILHRFITQEEEDTADRISDSRLRNREHSMYRKFLIGLALPFAASRMDRERRFYIRPSEWYSEIEKGWQVYFDNKNIKRNFTKTNGYRADEIRYDDDITDAILLSETAYCSFTGGEYGFSHQYFRDYFAARHILNILSAAQALEKDLEDPIAFILNPENAAEMKSLDYTWSDEVCLLLGEMTGDYRRKP